MAPTIHPPCTPSASCAPIRCHPSAPICRTPEKCLKKTISKGIRPCPSALSQVSTLAKTSCRRCGKYPGSDDPRNTSAVMKYLKVKSKEGRMKKKDRIRNEFNYLKYLRKKGRRKSRVDCCAGHGHRGRLKRPAKCEIL